MQLNLTDRVKLIIKEINYATLATISEDGEPWNTPVYFAYDNDYNIYWGSHINSQHSKNIRSTGKVFIVIYNTTVPPGTGEGVYIRATCSELSEADVIKDAYAIIKLRRKPLPYFPLKKLKGLSQVRLYKATPHDVWTNDIGKLRDGTTVDVRLKTTF